MGLKGWLLCILVPTIAMAEANGAPLKVRYQLNNRGTVSLAVYDAQGVMVRELLTGVTQPAGAHATTWDGLDSQGQPVPAGNYQWKGVRANIRVQYHMTVGNTGQPPYWTSDGKGSWGGWNPSTAASDGENWYLLFRMEEGQPCLIKVDRAGKSLWKTRVPSEVYGSDIVGGAVAIACGEKYVYIAGTEDSYDPKRFTPTREGLWRVNREDGSHVPWPGGKLVLWLTETRTGGEETQLYMGLGAIWAKLRQGNYTDPYPLTGVRGLAVSANRIYVPLCFENNIAVYDDSGSRIDEIPGVSKPNSVALTRDGQLLAASGKQILLIDPGTKQSKPLVTSGLEFPWGLATDGAGNIYVTDLGASQQIKQFSPEGKPLLTVGKKGGDLQFRGPMPPDVLHFPLGLAVNRYGEICVADSGVPGFSYGSGARHLIFDRQGKPVRQWFVVGMTENNIGVPAEDPTQLFTGYGGLYRCKVDLPNKRWQWTHYWHPTSWHGIFWDPHTLAVPKGQKAIARVRQGKTYVFLPGLNVSLFRVDGDALTPVVVLGSWLPEDFEKGWEPYLKGHQFVRTKPGFPGAGGEKLFLWQDKNNDGHTQPGEIAYGQTPDKGGAFSSFSEYLDGSFNLYLINLLGSPESARGSIYLLPCKGFDQNGVPQYDLAKMTTVVKNGFLPMEMIPGKNDNYSNYDFYMRTDASGSIYAVQTTKGASKGLGWAADIHRSVITKWSPEGRLLWRVGKKATGFAKPGENYRMTYLSGVEKGFVFATDVAGPERIYTTDGLYAGSLLKDQHRGDILDEYFITAENFAHLVITDPNTRETWLIGGYDGVNYYRILGLEEAQRLGGTVKLQQMAAPATAVSADSADGVTTLGSKAEIFFVQSADKSVRVDGDLSEWNLRLGAGPITPDPTDAQMTAIQGATVFGSYDAQNFYIAAHVNDLTPLRNEGHLTERWWYWDSLQVRLRMPTDAVQLGLYYDSKIGRHFAWKGSGGPKGYSTIVPDFAPAKVATKRDAAGKGYTLEASIPWAELDKQFTPAAGARFRCGLQMNWNGPIPNEYSPTHNAFWGGGQFFTIPDQYAPAVLLPSTANHAMAVMPAGSDINIDGDLKEWGTTDVALIETDKESKEFQARVRTAHSADHLYVAFEVNDSSPMKNVGGDIRTAFKTGDTVEVFLSTNPKDDARRDEPTAGDYRVLMTYLENTKPVIAAFRAVITGQQPVYVASGGGRTRLDRVEEIPDARMAVSRRKDGSGYILEAALPWNYFGVNPANLVAQADFAVNFSDRVGRTNVLKTYWSGSNAMVTDIAQELRLRPNQWGWIAVIGR